MGGGREGFNTHGTSGPFHGYPAMSSNAEVRRKKAAGWVDEENVSPPVLELHGYPEALKPRGMEAYLVVLEEGLLGGGREGLNTHGTGIPFHGYPAKRKA